MILSVSLQNVSSYSPAVPTVLGPLKKINLIYGQNGTGKSTIGNYLQAMDQPAFQNCTIDEQAGPQDVCVYNQSFIEKNFHGGSQPGVFTLNQGNIEAEKALEEADAAIKSLEADLELEIKGGLEIRSAQEALEQALKDGVWALRKQVEPTALRYCLQGQNTKERMLEKVISMVHSVSPDTFADLAAEADELLKADDRPIQPIQKLTLLARAVEHDELLQEKIIGSDESYLSALIMSLGNSDWVKHSFSYLNEQSHQCPLCQQQLPEEFYENLRKVFDTTYEERIDRLQILRSKYASGLSQVISQIESVEYPTSELTQLTSDLKALLIENFNFIETKISTPSMVITLSSTSSLIEEINRLIELEQVRIDAFNQKVREKKKHLNIINDRFWHCYRDACADLVNDTQPKLEVLKLQRSEKRDVVQQIRTHINVQRQVIVDSRSKITNIDQSVENINRWLGLLGLHGFELLREEGQIPQYRLQRPQSQDKVFKSLSEGEKTLISFLYFLEVCNGELDAQSTKQKSQRIVVIDDPISSLFHNYIYDVASLIRRHVLLPSNRFKQVIVMTHNLFFYHELMKLVEDDKRENEMALFKVSKATHSAIQTLSKRDIKNDYHAFWHTIKDALEGKASPALIPNMMRNILEYYFSFVQRKDKLWKVIDELSEQNPDFRALYRYINRESHSDPVNLTEFGDIDPKQYLEQFKKIFVVTDFEEHYNLMMA